MKFSEFSASKFLKAADLPDGKDVPVTVDQFEEVDMDDGKKLAVRFRGKNKLLLLNLTNREAISDVFGDDVRLAVGKQVVLYKDKTRFQGATVACVRLKVEDPRTPEPQPDEAEAQQSDEETPW